MKQLTKTILKYEEFKQTLIIRIEEDIQKSKERLNAHIQYNNLEQIAFEKGFQNSLTTCLFDINDLDRNYYNEKK